MKHKLLLAALVGLAFASSASAASRTYFERESFDESFEGFNNTTATAENLGTLWGGDSITVNGAHSTKSWGGTSADFYRLTLGINTLLTASIEGWKPTNQTTVGTTFSILSSTGALVATGATLAEQLSAGTYYVRVASSSLSYNYVINGEAALSPAPEADMASLAVLAFGAVGFAARRRNKRA